MRNRKWFALTLSLPKTVFSLPISANYRCKLKLSYLRLPYCLGFLGTNPLASSLHHPTPTSLRKRNFKSFVTITISIINQNLPIPTQFLGELMRLILTEYTVRVKWQYHYTSFSFQCQFTVGQLSVSCWYNVAWQSVNRLLGELFFTLICTLSIKATELHALLHLPIFDFLVTVDSISSTFLSKVAGCWRKSLPTWFVTGGYSA